MKGVYAVAVVAQAGEAGAGRGELADAEEDAGHGGGAELLGHGGVGTDDGDGGSGEGPDEAVVVDGAVGEEIIGGAVTDGTGHFGCSKANRGVF